MISTGPSWVIRRDSRRLAGSLCLAACLTCLALGLQANSDERAVDFQGRTLAGDQFRFRADQLDRPVLAVFWASWCRECRYEFHELKKLHSEMHERLDIYGVSVDKDIAKAARIADRARLPYLNLHDPEARIAALYQVRGTPTLLLIDRSGRIRHRGHRLNQRLRMALDHVLDAS